MSERPSQEKETGRLEAFSDGVFAIAITLLALELKVPHVEQPSVESLLRALSTQWPGYFAFITSFFTVLIMWVHHHRILRTVHRADAPLLFTNGLLLFLITAVPFPTAVLAEYLRTPAARAASAFYAGVFFGIGIAFCILLHVAIRRSLRPESIEKLKREYYLGPPLYLGAAFAAGFSAWLCLAICTGLWIFWAATAREC